MKKFLVKTSLKNFYYQLTSPKLHEVCQMKRFINKVVLEDSPPQNFSFTEFYN